MSCGRDSNALSWPAVETLRAERLVVLPSAEAWLVDRFADLASGRPDRGRVVAVLGGRGGAGASVLAACTLGPDYKRPTTPAAATYKELEGTGWKTAEPADAKIRSAWWEVYDDPALNALEQQVASANQKATE